MSIGQKTDRRGILFRLFLTLCAITWAASLVVLAAATRSTTGESGGVESTAANLLLAAVLLTFLAALPLDRRWSGVWLVVGGGIALTVVVLGLVVYGPCASAEDEWFALPGWILRIFVGEYDTEGPGATCSLAFSPASELARTLGLGLTVVAAAVSVVFLIARLQFDRIQVRLRADVDVVVGLDKLTLPLAKALVEQNRSRPRLDPWIDPRPGWLGGIGPGEERPPGWLWWWLTGWRPGDMSRVLKRRTKTIVIDPDPNNPLAGEARRLGAVVIFGDATDERVLGFIVTRRLGRRHRVALRRLFAVQPDESRNLHVWDTLRRLLEGSELLPHVDDVVPRVFVRMNDARNARSWRVSQVQRLGEGGDHSLRQRSVPALVSDALSMDGIAAELASSYVLPQRQWLHEQQSVAHLVLIGESGLALAILDELAWQSWCRFEVALESGQRPALGQPGLARVTLAGPKAQVRCSEWEDLLPPLALPGAALEDRLRLFNVMPDDRDPEVVAAEALEAASSAVVIFVENSASYAAAAARLARRFPGGSGQVRVMLRGSDQLHATEQTMPGGLLEFAPTLAQDSPAGPVPPSDSVTRLARQQHQAMFRASSGWPSGEPCADLQREERVTRRDWVDLPGFFQEDNVRQHWRILTWFVEEGYVWKSVRAAEVAESELLPPRPDDWPDVLENVAEAEYERWRDLRVRRGWWTGPRHDAGRLNPELPGWESANQGYNVQQVQRILDRLWATGLSPERLSQTEPQSPPDGR